MKYFIDTTAFLNLKNIQVRKNRFFISAIFTFFFIINNIYAAHIIGGELTYQCLGNGDYSITLKVYRDCQNGGAGFDEDGTMSIYRSDDLNNEFAMAMMPLPTVTAIDPSIGNPCLLTPPEVCVQEGIYNFRLSDLGINLPDSPFTYHLIYQRCCRNSTISNIINPGDTGVTYSIDISPESQDLCNSSPSFESFPPIIICVNNPLEFVQTATDIDGDELRYELCSPLKGAGTDGAITPGDIFSFTGATPNPDAPPPFDPVNYYAPTYSFNSPLGAMPILTIDSLTGLLTGTPNTIGQFVVGICVKEYRNGKLLSKVQRDFQFNVDFCEPGIFATMGGDELIAEQIQQPQYIYYSCGDPQVFFENQSYPSEFIDGYEWKISLANGDTLFSDQPNLDVTFPDLGIYSGVLILNPGSICTDSSFIEIRIYPGLDSDFNIEYDDICDSSPIQFTDQSTTESSDIISWFWDFGDGNTSDQPHPIHQYNSPDIYSVSLQITDSNGCVKTSSQELTWMPVPSEIMVTSDIQEGCAPIDINFTNQSFPLSEVYDFSWDFGEGGVSDDMNPAYEYFSHGLFSVNVSITSPNGCNIEEKFEEWINVFPNPIAEFSYSPDPVNYFSPIVQFNNQSSYYDNLYWDFGGMSFSYEENPEFTFPDSGIYIVELSTINDYGCTDTIQKVIDIIPEVTLFLPNAFSPNYDGINDLYFPMGYFDFAQDYQFYIFNRVGDLIFETNDPSQGWDGKNIKTNKLVSSGIYNCTVSYKDTRGKFYKKNEVIAVIK